MNPRSDFDAVITRTTIIGKAEDRGAPEETEPRANLGQIAGLTVKVTEPNKECAGKLVVEFRGP
jgi:hypothetical protein